MINKFLPLLLFCGIAHASTAYVDVCFTPGSRCDEKIISEISQAKKSILVQAYQLTSKPISNALIDAANAGVRVDIILDKTQDSKKKYSPAQLFFGSNIPVWIDRKPRIAHNKIMIIDGTEVITGSYNFSRAAQFSNAENVVFIRSQEISNEYTKNFNLRMSKSEFYPTEKSK